MCGDVINQSNVRAATNVAPGSLFPIALVSMQAKANEQHVVWRRIRCRCAARVRWARMEGEGDCDAWLATATAAALTAQLD